VWHTEMCGTEGRANQQRIRRACVAQFGSVWAEGACRRERTSNMRLMSVTLEVSKLSGWLKRYAFCRVQRGHPTQGSAWHEEVAQREGHISSARSVRVWPTVRECVGRRRQVEAHPEHAVHVCDAGGVKAQRLAESIRTLPSPKGASDKGTTRVAHGDVAQREGRISTARSVRVWPSSGVGAEEPAGGSAHRT
jgi:hypothetical protein